jgi:hypothetical protein
MLKVNICKCGRPELFHSVGCYGNPYPDLYEKDKTIICAISKTQLEEFFGRLEGPEGCNFTEDGKWLCDGKTTSFAKKILISMNLHPEDIAKLLKLFELFGGYCDCEILFNSEDHIMDLVNNSNPQNIRKIQNDKIKEYEKHKKHQKELIKNCQVYLKKIKELSK